MSDHAASISLIEKAESLDEISEIARSYPAKSVDQGGILYSSWAGDVSSEVMAVELSEKTGLPIINDTPRAKFLMEARTAIEEKASEIFRSQGLPPKMAKESAASFLFGDPAVPSQSPTSLSKCLWGEASHEFASSLRGDIKVVASAANLERVFGQVEVPAVLNNPNVNSLGGQPIPKLQALYAQGGAGAVLPEVQTHFIQAAPKGIFVAPESIGSKIEKVTFSREFAGSLELQQTHFKPSAELSASGMIRAPTGLDAPAVGIAETALSAEVAASRRLSSGTVRGLGIVGAAAAVYDLGGTARNTERLDAQGNSTAADAEVTRYATRNLGTFGGAVLGSSVGAALGVESGPGLLVTGAVGGIVGAVGGDKLADVINDHRISHQQDAQGNTWRLENHQAGERWARDVSTGEVDPAAVAFGEAGVPLFKTRTEVATPEVADLLTFKASRTSIELALGSPPQNKDPYTQPANEHDTRSLRESPWVHNANTQQWTRQIADGLIDRTMSTHTETASPQRASQLDAASQQIIRQNAMHTPAAMAAHYKETYEQNGWERHAYMPAAVHDALKHPGRIVGSDGDLYERGKDGQWAHDGMLWDSQAKGNLKQELDGTYAAQTVGAQRTAAQPAAQAAAEPIKTLATVHVTAPQMQSHDNADTSSKKTQEDKDVRGHSTLARPQASGPQDPDHPDHAMLKQIREGVAKIDQSVGKPYDEMSERVSRCLLAACKDNRERYPDAGNTSLAANALQRVDHVLMGKNGNLFAVEGRLDDPTHKRVVVSIDQAIHIPLEQSDAKLQAANQAIAQEQTQTRQQELARSQQQDGQQSLRMSV
ncbi:XVIPCD domain-containing protein [Xanthomonas sp. WHRI 10064A]|uniref:XVIPCD domain-containing protein n=1 Tax=unclassified Xanthomonas TaxID=2643310 RepID=UPI002B2247D7|nr:MULTISPECIES: XVIPCD domain-containing protein [unclassified Xanthomonas]MEA9588713.1 XVIPCD domain-containing protein [Xanthomonas sp. WHRI 10064B]MEA9613698.1 XVIPCD domain-containing protein [Xanthomonas sp. WHRI 10064A]